LSNSRSGGSNGHFGAPREGGASFPTVPVVPTWRELIFHSTKFTFKVAIRVMSRIEKTVFISYRRANVPWALAIFQDLTRHGYDAFFDFQGIASGDFECVILENIRARAHFLVLLTPSALERCGDQGDWLRREIETALETRRNIVPLMLE